MRNGDFSSIISAGFRLADPLTRTGTFPNITQSFFPNNQIPARPPQRRAPSFSCQVYAAAESARSAPGCPSAIINIALTTPIDKDTLTERIDFNESANSQWFGRYSWNDESAFATHPA